MDPIRGQSRYLYHVAVRLMFDVFTKNMSFWDVLEKMRNKLVNVNYSMKMEIEKECFILNLSVSAIVLFKLKICYLFKYLNNPPKTLKIF